MSSYLCETRHIVSLAIFAAEASSTLNKEDNKPVLSRKAIEVANILMKMNYLSVSARYNKNDSTSYDEIEKTVLGIMEGEPHSHPMFQGEISYPGIVKSAECLRYQSIDTDEYDGSEADKILTWIIDECVKLSEYNSNEKLHASSEYEESEWGEYKEPIDPEKERATKRIKTLEDFSSYGLTETEDGVSLSTAEKIAIKNVRKMLKIDYPEIKFSVRSENYGIRVAWEDGPSRPELDNKLSIFNTHNENDKYLDLYGHVYHIRGERDLSLSFEDAVITLLKDEYDYNDADFSHVTCEALRLGELRDTSPIGGVDSGNISHWSWDNLIRRKLLETSEVQLINEIDELETKNSVQGESITL